MKQVVIIIFLFCAFGSFAQNTSVKSDKRVLSPELVIQSIDQGNTNALTSDAVPVTGQKYETSQQHTLLLVPEATTPGATTGQQVTASETATPLPASATSTSQADKMILVPVNTQKP